MGGKRARIARFRPNLPREPRAGRASIEHMGVCVFGGLKPYQPEGSQFQAASDQGTQPTIPLHRAREQNQTGHWLIFFFLPLDCNVRLP